MQRRKFLKQTIQGALLPSILGGLSVKAWANSPLLQSLSGANNDHVLVLVQLSGGNDGLNTLIPLEFYSDYNRIRPNIAIPENRVLALNNNLKTGLHPSLTGMQQMYNEEKLCAIQAVGYPSPNGSHFRSMDIWLTGSDTNQYLSTGWAGRYLNHQFPNYPIGFPNDVMPDPLALQIGSVLSPVFLSPTGFNALAIDESLNFYNLIDAIQDPVPNTPSGNELTYLRTVAKQTNRYAEAITSAAAKVTQQSPYPADNYLAAQLKAVAKLVAGGLKTKIYMVSMGGFDTHAGQVNGGNTLTGNHSALLKQVSEAITAFTKDLKFLGVSNRVLGMTFSEFGRRMQSNGSLGTDHGAAQPVFLFGDAVKQGVLGKNPDIPATTQAIDNVPMQYDFRSVYSTILRDWFCLPPNEVENVLLKNYQYLPVIQSTACNMDILELNNLGDNLIINYPNPFTSSTTITFKSAGGHTLVQVFDTTGKRVAILADKVYDAGTYSVTFNSASLASGVYYARLQNGSLQQVRPMLKAR
ncbi:MAG: DUF1501 domain-containing protein [Ferruginibacter sp.]|nr:DUF1501 domain-containing protein [Bacteroidota bacterium]MBX2917852.1 DUF1501 domain-containing protein [Ferruginibacter sp.]MCB0708662.1 DUF1501 domain-containing protein [Chitinophagaceae bacterium]MCC7379944.1 DUF1501 domain-containing protein [Chitinophagaceae bacterium]